jgi:hypothetical protein
MTGARATAADPTLAASSLATAGFVVLPIVVAALFVAGVVRARAPDESDPTTRWWPARTPRNAC